MMHAHLTPYSTPVVARDIKAEMVAYMLSRGDCTREDLLLAGFTPVQIDRHGPLATQEANRRSTRRLA